jgi:chorismate lyase/3-hydroxybenzoate synthase
MLTFVFGETSASVAPIPGGIRIGVPCPVLSGDMTEVFPLGDGLAEASGEWTVLRAQGMSVFAVAATMDDDSVETVTTRLYDELFRLTRGLHLYRVWHFIPGILSRNDGREETYRRFCIARGVCFDAAFPDDAEARMPAATAVGVDGDRILLVVLAGEAAPEHFENPDQTPAYRYPGKYGARSPSFSRATRVTTPAGTWTFLSGTAAIRGSESRHPGDFAAQLAVIRGNLESITSVAAPASGPTDVWSKWYLKPGDTPPWRDALTGASADPLVVRAHICRPELLLESEMTIHHPSTSP